VEVCTSEAGTIAIRDSNDPTGPELELAGEPWAAMVAEIKRGEHDL
jgi:Domain of unknown function (DUF397)